MSEPASVVPMKIDVAPESSKDPIRIMVEIAENERLSDTDKNTLIQYAQSRFDNRRRMAYIALYSIIFSLLLIFLAIFIDGFNDCQSESCGKSILVSIKNGENIIIWIEGFLASIVAAYYGASAWRPSS